jgi:hypothetical protein
MQQSDGLFANFILDWAGTPNLSGPTSYPGGEWWFARAMYALAEGADYAAEICVPAFQKGLERLVEPFADSRVQAIALLALLAARQTIDDGLQALCRKASGILASQVSDGLESRSWLWGEIQEGALAAASIALGDANLRRLAVGSAARRFADVPDVLRSCETLIPYDASTVAWLSHRLYEASGDGTWLYHLEAAISWFYGCNSAGVAIYDVHHGLVYDGISSGVVSSNSGAESNIEGWSALAEWSWLKCRR